MLSNFFGVYLFITLKTDTQHQSDDPASQAVRSAQTLTLVGSRPLLSGHLTHPQATAPLADRRYGGKRTLNTLFEILDADPDRYTRGEPNIFPSAIGRVVRRLINMEYRDSAI